LIEFILADNMLSRQ